MGDKVEISSKTVGKAVAWSFAAELAAKIIIPLSNIILARIIAPEAFGIIATINMIVSFADMFSTMGISKYIVQHEFETEEELKRNADVAFWTNIVISLSAWAVISIFSKQLSGLFGNPGYELALIVAAMSLPLTAFSCIQEAVFQRALNYKVLFYRRLVVSLIPLVVTVPLALLGLRHWSIIIGTITGNVVKILMLSFSSPWKPGFYYSFKILKQMFSFCFWMLMGAISSWGITYVDVMLISDRMGEYYTGLYKNSQTTVVGIISIITASVASVLFSTLSRVQNDSKKFNEILFNFQRKIGMLVIPLGVGIYCFSDLVTYVLLGTRWMEASPFIGVWGLSTAIACVFADFCKEACKAKNKPQVSFYVQMLHLAFLMPVCYNAVNLGFEAFGRVRSLANLEMVLLYFIFLKIVLKISPTEMLLKQAGPVISALVMGFAGKLMLNYLPNGYIMQFVYVAVCAIVYFGVLLIFKPYRAELEKMLVAVKAKLFRERG